MVPAVAVQLLHSLLAVLDKGQSEDALRPHLYAALLSFMQYCQGSRSAQASPQILKAVLQAGHASHGSHSAWALPKTAVLHAGNSCGCFCCVTAQVYLRQKDVQSGVSSGPDIPSHM